MVTGSGVNFEGASYSGQGGSFAVEWVAGFVRNTYLRCENWRNGCLEWSCGLNRSTQHLISYSREEDVAYEIQNQN